jgi:pyruvate/2-oxoglutarate dehydrogenase complex dihydrolipoamide dehydrogenase (E3) component
MSGHCRDDANRTKPVSIVQLDNGRYRVTYNTGGNEHSDEYDTVLTAIGRTADTHTLGLDKVGVRVHDESKKVVVNDVDRTTVDNIYAIGDAALGRPELTPVAIHAGRFLGHRLFNGPRAEPMHYHLVPTTVFTPLEYNIIHAHYN